MRARILGCLMLFCVLVATSGCISDTDATMGALFTTLAGVICFLYTAIKALVGPIAVFLIIWAGLKWTGSRDNPQDRDQAKRMVEGVLVGLIIVVVATAIVSIIINDAGYACGATLTPKKI